MRPRGGRHPACRCVGRHARPPRATPPHCASTQAAGRRLHRHVGRAPHEEQSCLRRHGGHAWRRNRRPVRDATRVDRRFSAGKGVTPLASPAGTKEISGPNAPNPAWSSKPWTPELPLFPALGKGQLETFLAFGKATRNCALEPADRRAYPALSAARSLRHKSGPVTT